MVNEVDVMVQQDGDVGLRCLLLDLLYGTLIFHAFLVQVDSVIL